jgi:hypothetical protein
MGMGNVYRILVKKPEVKRSLLGSSPRERENVKTDLRQMEYEEAERVQIFQDKVQ